jgi:hypothetical protein
VNVDPLPATLEKLGIQKGGALARGFTYDRAYDSSTTQEQLFSESVAPVVDEVLRGFSCTVFCYGQTGTGKTYTMEGPKRADGGVETEGAEAGIIPRAIKRIFAALPSRGEEGCDWVVKVSFLEIYNEKLDDLLSADPSSFQEAGGSAAGHGMGGAGPKTGGLGVTGMGGGGAGGGGGGDGLPPASASSGSGAAPLASQPGSFAALHAATGGAPGEVLFEESISTLAKTSLDWDGYKAREGLSEDFTSAARGAGVVEKAALLARLDERGAAVEAARKAAEKRERDIRAAAGQS